MIQGGAGTSTNMNANEVIANRALEILGHSKGEYKFLHPNDDVNCSQSTNDAYPTAIKLAVYFSMQDTLGALGELQDALLAKEKEFAQVLKMGRTENQDAVPMTLGQEFGAYAAMIDRRHGEHDARRRRTAGDQHGRHGHRHRHQQPAGLCRAGHEEAWPTVSGLPVAQGGEPGGGHPGLRRLRRRWPAT